MLSCLFFDVVVVAVVAGVPVIGAVIVCFVLLFD